MTDGVPKRQSVELDNSSCVVEKFCQQLLKQAGEAGFGDDELFGIHLALEEAFTNAVKHGNCGDPDKKVNIEYLITPKLFDITISDEGCGFVPDEVPDPRDDENIFKPGGRGLLLMNAYMDAVEYNQAGNSVHMIKHNVSEN